MGNTPKELKVKGIPFVPGQWFPLELPYIKVGLGWDFHSGDVFDLDASVVAFDECNQVMTSVYYSHKKDFNGAIHHHGDNLTGRGSGDDEVISTHLDKLPQKVMSLAVCINSYKGNSIIKAKQAFIRLYEGKKKKEIGMFILNQTKDCIGLMLGLFEKNNQDGNWFFRVMVDPIEGNVVTSSYNSIITLLNGYSLNTQIVNKPRHPLPGENLFTPETWIELKNFFVYVGLGWDVLPGNVYDLDASIISFDNLLNVIDIVYHKNGNSKDGAIRHYGDNRTGIGEGDDELLSIDFNILNSNIVSLAVIVNSFKGNNMTGLQSAFIRLFEQNAMIGCHILGQGSENVGLLLGLFRKDTVNNIWWFQVVIQGMPGNEATEAIPVLKNFLTSHKMPL